MSIREYSLDETFKCKYCDRDENKRLFKHNRPVCSLKHFSRAHWVRYIIYSEIWFLFILFIHANKSNIIWFIIDYTAFIISISIGIFGYAIDKIESNQEKLDKEEALKNFVVEEKHKGFADFINNFENKLDTVEK